MRCRKRRESVSLSHTTLQSAAVFNIKMNDTPNAVCLHAPDHMVQKNHAIWFGVAQKKKKKKEGACASLVQCKMNGFKDRTTLNRMSIAHECGVVPGHSVN